jgi:hypothetical protein
MRIVCHGVESFILCQPGYFAPESGVCLTGKLVLKAVFMNGNGKASFTAQFIDRQDGDEKGKEGTAGWQRTHRFILYDEQYSPNGQGNSDCRTADAADHIGGYVKGFGLIEALMKPNQRPHLRGWRGQAFADLVRGVCPEQILCVSIDVSKDFHVVLLHNGLGEIVTPSFEIDIFRTGFDQLCQAVEAAIATNGAQVVLVGMEPTGHYYENLARHLQAMGQKVTLVNSFAVKENRRQQMMAHEKDDEIDVAAIGDLLRRGEGSPFRPPTGIYLQMQQLDRARLGELKIQTIYKNRVIGHLDRIFPGLILTKAATKERYTPLFATDFWQCQTLQDLVRICPDPRQLAAFSPADLVALFHQHGCRMGPRTASCIIAYAQKVLWPDPKVVAIRCQLLATDLQTLDQVTARVDLYSQQLRQLLAQTPYQFLAQFKGLPPLRVAMPLGRRRAEPFPGKIGQDWGQQQEVDHPAIAVGIV